MHHRLTTTLFVAALLTASSAVALPTSPAAAEPAPPIVVTTVEDVVDAGDGALSLREAVDQANGQAGLDVIQLDATASGTRTYLLDSCGGATQEDANLDGDLDLTGGPEGTTIDGGSSTIRQTCEDERVLDAPSGQPLRLEDLTVTGGDAVGSGGGVRMQAGPGTGVLQVDGVAIRGNAATANGAGLRNVDGPTELSHSSITENRSEIGLGAGADFSGGPVNITSSTISHNWTVEGSIGGLRSIGWPLHLDHVTILANRSVAGNPLDAAANLSATVTTAHATVVGLGVGGPDCALPPGEGWMTSQGGNVDGDGTCRFDADGDLPSGHPMVSVPDDAGATTVHEPATVSPLVDVVAAVDCTVADDQLGRPRVNAGSGCDAGAAERLNLRCASEFTDVGPSHPFADEVCWLAQMGITTGFGDGTFRPAAPVTRQSMSAFLYRWRNAPPFELPAGAGTFTDVSSAHAFVAPIEWMAAEGIATGSQPGPTFRPAAPVTRQSMAAFLHRLAGSPVSTDPPTPTFDDVSATHPFFHEVEWLAGTTITTGYADGTFRPAAPVTRQSMAAFLLRLAQRPPDLP